ncbi:MAG: transglycosylase SLT domain-containing protein [Deltaproteobacteria bacterium]|nr:transglycosylase SLT domain-containing protein [Deltaproteobacteria bacterium]
MNREWNYRIAVAGILLLLCGMGQEGKKAWGEGEGVAASATGPFVVPYFAVPEGLEFCGEPVPVHQPDVRERLDREFTLVVYSHAQVYLWLKRMERYFPWLEKELLRNGLPDDLKYVAVAESDLILSAASPAGAVGPWQFIRATGARFDLTQTNLVDERMDFETSTVSAFRYLRSLHQMFSNWTLAVAAYNCGEKRVQDEMRKQRVDNYYALKLPLETERYILRIVSIKEVLGNPGRYGYSLPKTAAYPAIRVDRVNVRLSGSTPVVDLAEAAGITYREFKNLNPVLISDVVPEGTMTLKVPEGKGTEFLRRIEGITRRQGSPVLDHRVSKGETLSGIAARYGVSEQCLMEANGMKDKTVRTGQVLKISK